MPFSLAEVQMPRSSPRRKAGSFRWVGRGFVWSGWLGCRWDHCKAASTTQILYPYTPAINFLSREKREMWLIFWYQGLFVVVHFHRHHYAPLHWPEARGGGSFSVGKWWRKAYLRRASPCDKESTGLGSARSLRLE